MKAGGVVPKDGGGSTESIIGFAIRRSIRENPEQAAAEMLGLMRSLARMEAELFGLRQALRKLAQTPGEA